jgi:N-acetyl-1-D-myo-inositol-2-amino-2-deoxy-alpha-D-glucopyranoside deacetylase
MSPSRPLTLLTVHAHPDDESIGTGGTMAKAVAAGHRVVLVTCTRGELGEIVVPDLETPENHRRLGELRAVELERAVAELGVGEWDNLGYRDSGMVDSPGNVDPRSFWRADLDEAIGRLTWMIRRFRPDVMTTYNDFGGYGHPDHIRAHQVAVGAFERSGDPAWYPEQVAPDHGGRGPTEAEGGLLPWAPAKLYEQAIPASTRTAMADALAELGRPNPWALRDDATAEERAEFEERAARMLMPDERIGAWIDIAGEPLERKWRATLAHVTQIGPDSFFMALGIDGWRRFWHSEAYVLRESRVPVAGPETDLFAGLGG